MAETQQIPPLSTGQKLFLQRLLVAHVLPDNSARDLYNNIRQRSINNNDDDEDDMCDSMERCIGRINRSLSLGFGLEIRTIIFEEFENDNDDDVESSEQQPSSTATRRTKYHAIVNKQSDDIAKRWAFLSHNGTPSAKPHLLAYFRLILEKMTQSEFSNFEPTHTGCRISWDTIDLINLRNDLDGDHANKISMDEAEAALMRFTDDGWFIDATSSSTDKNSSSGRKKQQRRRRPRLMIGPRTYMELSELMEMLLGGKERMPQFILHAG